MQREIGKQRILHVDLAASKSWVEDVPQADLQKYLGGRGLAAKWLYDRVPAGADPLGPENILIFGTGTLTGTSAPSSGRSSVTTKGPATRLYLKVSVGGHLGAEIKYAGYDYVMIHGVSPRPVYIWIKDDQVELRDASHLWGRGTRETDDLIKEELGDPGIQTGVIGPAGENRVKFACLMVSRYNAAARGGVGAVFGSKNLKAIACRGTGGLSLAKGNEYFALARRMRVALAADDGSKSLYNWGTAGLNPRTERDGHAGRTQFQPRVDRPRRAPERAIPVERRLPDRPGVVFCLFHGLPPLREQPVGDMGPCPGFRARAGDRDEPGGRVRRHGHRGRPQG